MKNSILLKTIILAGSLMLQLIMLPFHTHAAPGDVDLSFDPGSGLNCAVQAAVQVAVQVVVQPDGKVIIGGEFTTVRGLARINLARLNADGSGDSSFNAGTNSSAAPVRAITLQPDGKVLVGNSEQNPFLIRLNADGSLDSTFTASIGPSQSFINLIALQSDGRILVFGNFAVNGTNCTVARLHTNGNLDTSFNPVTGSHNISSVALQLDGKVLICRSFYWVNGTNRSGVARLNADGSLDSSFNPLSAAVEGGISVALQPDGKVLLAGRFAVNGTNYTIARFNSNGTRDTSFNLSGINGYVAFAALQPDGKVLIRGSFRVNGNGADYHVGRLHSNGSFDNTFNPVSGFDILSVTLQPDARVLIASISNPYLVTNSNRIARFTANGNPDGTFNTGGGLASRVSSLVVQSDGKVLIGGPALTFINGTNRYARARLNADGSLDSAFIPGSFPDLGFPYDELTAAAVQSDGKVLLSGYTHLYECNESGVCFLLGTSYFFTRLNANGSRDTNFNPVIEGSGIYSIVVQSDGKVLIGGAFWTVNGTNVRGIARLNANGSLDSSFDPGSGVAGGASTSVYSVAVQSDGKVLIAGDFTTVNGSSGNRIARLNANGSLDESFDPGTGVSAGSFPLQISSVVAQSDGKVLIGGSFTTVNGTSRNGIARLNANGSLDSTFNPGTGANGVVRSIALQSDGNVLIGGDFTTVNGVLRPYVARLYGDSVIVPSLSIARSGAFAILSWTSTAAGFQLEETTDLSLPDSWSPVVETAVINGAQLSVTVPTTAPRKFFRLKSQ